MYGILESYNNMLNKYIKKLKKFGKKIIEKRKSIRAEKYLKIKAKKERELEKITDKFNADPFEVIAKNIDEIYEVSDLQVLGNDLADWEDEDNNPPKLIELYEPVYRYNKDGVIIENIYKPAIIEHLIFGSIKPPTKTSVIPYVGRDELTNQPPEEPEVDRIRRFRESEARKAQKVKVKPLTNKEKDALYLKRFLETK